MSIQLREAVMQVTERGLTPGGIEPQPVDGVGADCWEGCRVSAAPFWPKKKEADLAATIERLHLRVSVLGGLLRVHAPHIKALTVNFSLHSHYHTTRGSVPNTPLYVLPVSFIVLVSFLASLSVARLVSRLGHLAPPLRTLSLAPPFTPTTPIHVTLSTHSIRTTAPRIPQQVMSLSLSDSRAASSAQLSAGAAADGCGGLQRLAHQHRSVPAEEWVRRRAH